MAAEKAFNLPEILENVLLRVDAKTLLLSQRVSAQFNATIAASPRLQEKLFFRQPRAPRDETNPLLPWENLKGISISPNEHINLQAPDRGFGFSMNYAEPQTTTRRYIMIDLTASEHWSGNESWRRMHIFHDGRLLNRLGYRWRHTLTLPSGRRPRRFNFVSPGRIDPIRESSTITMGELFDKAVGFAREQGFQH
ncbi:hypothetical protein PRZ48_008495 [Zasmidium cellare]|uniref:F-box domain-containing protein n=1 Tax=Zasmidium cellare TaxID=395010 RepID=A0ABR0EGC0_ZASCE|nr:hypothetical protein PRZ48_008495 [Zasmidium cellare]